METTEKKSLDPIAEEPVQEKKKPRSEAQQAVTERMKEKRLLSIQSKKEEPERFAHMEQIFNDYRAQKKKEKFAEKEKEKEELKQLMETIFSSYHQKLLDDLHAPFVFADDDEDPPKVEETAPAPAALDNRKPVRDFSRFF